MTYLHALMEFDPSYLYKLLAAAGTFVVGIIIALIVGAIINHFTKRMKKWAKTNADFGPQFLLAVRVGKIFIQLSIVLLFLTQSVAFFGLEILTRLTEQAALYLPRLLLAGTVFLVGMYLARMVARKVLHADFDHKNDVSIGLEVLILITFILAALEIAGLQVQVFMETYRVILYMLAAIVALGVGIPLSITFAKPIKKLFKG